MSLHVALTDTSLALAEYVVPVSAAHNRGEDQALVLASSLVSGKKYATTDSKV